MTNNWVDLDNASMFFVIGANPAENHPASIAHLNKARYDTHGRNRNAGLIVVDPRQTRTARMISAPQIIAAAAAGTSTNSPNDMRKYDRYVRIRPGSNIAFINGVLNSIITWMYANPTATESVRFFGWHNSTAANSSSVGRQFTPDNGSTIKHMLTAAELTGATYSTDGGATWTAAPLTAGWPKYCDSRVKVDAATGDYKRAILKTSTNVLFSNMPEFAADVEDADCVFQRLRTHVSHYTPAVTSQISGCTEADIAAVRDAWIGTSRFASSDFGASEAITAAGHRSACIMYAMGATQFTSGSQGVRSYAVIQTLMGNMGRAGGGINALRGIHNVQGSTDMGVLYDLIPAYSGNPGVDQTYADYQNKLFGNRVLSQKASWTVDCTNANADLTFTAQTAGPAGNGISIAYLDLGPSTPLAVNVTATAITVDLATDAGGAITSTAADVKAAIDGFGAASTLVAVAYTGTQDGSGIVEAKAAAFLRKGSTASKSAYVAADIEWQQRGFYNMTREWFGNRDATTQADIDKLWACWPKGNGVQHIEAFRRMCPTVAEDPSAEYHYTPTGTAPRIKAAVVWGQNPAITEPNQGAVRTGLKNLDLLVVTDMFATETAQCSRKATGVTYLLPACSHVEEAGSVASSGRWIQWRDRARLPKTNSKSDLELLLRFAKKLADAGAFSHIQDQWKTMDAASLNNGGAGANPWTVLYGKYGWDGASAFDSVSGVDYEGNTLTGSEYVAEQIFKEECAPLDGYAGAGAPGFVGGHQGTMWIYSGANGAHGGAFNPDQTGNVHPPAFELNPDGSVSATPITWGIANKAKSRKGEEKYAAQHRQFPRYGWAWLLNRRVLYNNGELPGDVADVFVAPGYLARLWTIAGSNTLADWSWLYRAYNQLSDKPTVNTAAGQLHQFTGRFPGFTEPYETPYDGTGLLPNLLATYGKNTAAGSSLVPSDTPVGTAADYPLILTSIRCVEHFQGGPITRNNAWNVDCEPEPWVELNSVDAAKYGIADGDYVDVITARGNSVSDQEGRTAGGSLAPVAGWAKGFKARVGAGTLANQRVAPGTVAIPWHWGDRGLGVGSRANDLCIDASDANTRIPEYKACLCKIQKVTP